MAVRGFFLVSADGRPHWIYVWVLQSGAKSAVIEFFADDPKLLADPKPIGDFVDACRLAHAQMLVAGDPPLTVYDVEETIECLQWVMDAPFTAEQREVFRSEIIDGWKKKDAETIQSVSQVFKFRAELAKLPAEKQEFVRKQCEAEVVATLRKDTDKCSKLLTEIYDAAHKPIAEGDPALTRQQADSALELFFFMAAQLEGVQARPSATDKEGWATQLTAGWPKLDAGIKKSFATMPAAWAATRAGWTEMTEAEREGIKKQFAQLDFIKEMRTHFAKVKTEAGASADAAALQSKIQQNYSVTSSLLKMGYDSTMTQMASIMNMSSSNNRYSYRAR
jgi:predicted component of type VI protein secretion system